MDWVDCNVLEYIFTYISHCEIPEQKKKTSTGTDDDDDDDPGSQSNKNSPVSPSEKRLSQIVFEYKVYVFCACSRHVCEVFVFSPNVLLIFMYLM